MRPVVNDLRSGANKRFEVKLSLCEGCGFIRLDHEIPYGDFYSSYATPSSWKRIPHLDALLLAIEELVPTKASLILEIGSNDGSFLQRLQESGFTNLLGVEPSNFNSYKNDKKVNVIKDFFDEGFKKKYPERLNESPSLVVSRHVLEHVPKLDSFMETLREICGMNTKILIEVPHSKTFLEEQDIAFWEEHRNHFTRENLIDLFQRFGFSCVSWKEFIFSGRAQVAIFESTKAVKEPSDRQEARLANIESKINNLLDRLEFAKSKLSDLVGSVHRESGRVILFGVGSRSMGCLWSIDSVEGIDVFVDSSFGKVGFNVPGTSKKIDSEKWLENLEPNDLVLLGINYEDEQSAVAKIRGRCQVFSLLSPSDYNWLVRNY